MDLRLGSGGPDVERLQQKLTALRIYSGPIDGRYSPAVESAVRTFQANNALPADGVVGPKTMTTLFPLNMAEEPMAKRCLALTGSFETSKGPPDCFSGLAGNFDGQGFSFGALQWNIGQGTLQPMFHLLATNHADVVQSVFGDGCEVFGKMLALQKADQLQWCHGIQDASGRALAEPWNSRFFALGQTPEFQAIQLAQAECFHKDAVAMCKRFGVATERALALMFDILVQNGAVTSAVEAKIRADFAAIPAGVAPMDGEVLRLRSIANRKAEAANPTFVEDVRRRKLTIANGAGTVHGVVYNLESQFGIRLQPVQG
ncbi:MAG: hypothetical protein QOJ99_6244 [Bryobacterales bacterium]|jgi:hypothetical protein|nr:hypothetical protein [Bryobacterales bacterium]